MTTHNKSNAFSDAMEASVGSKAPICSGENGSDMYTMYGLSGDGDPVIGALVALFNGIVDDTSRETIVEYIENVEDTLRRSSVTDEQRSNFLADLVVSCFQVRNIRDNGKGRRDQCYFMWMELLFRFPETMMALLPELKEHGSFKDYNRLLDMYHGVRKYKTFDLSRLMDGIYDIYVEQIRADRQALDDWTKRKAEALGRGDPWDEKCELSLAVKWVPKEGRALDKKIKCTKELAKRMFPEEFEKDFKKAMKAFRRYYAPIQTAIKTTEVLECAGKFHEIDFRFVPGKTVFKKKKAYLYEHKKGGKLRGSDGDRLKCREHFLKHLEKAATGNAKVHGKTVYIHELVSAVYSNWGNLTEGDRLTYNAQFQSHVDHFVELMEEKGLAIDQGMFMPDVSGSMSGDPMAAAIGVALLGSTLAKGCWKDKFMTFESNPHWITLRYPKDKHAFDDMISGSLTGGSYRNSLGSYSYGGGTHPLGSWDPSRAGGELTFCEKVGVCYTAPWGGSTDFLAAHDLMLTIARENNVPKEDYPSWFLIPSDMHFNQADGSGSGLYSTMCSILGVRDWATANGKAQTWSTRSYVPSHGSSRYSYNSHSSQYQKGGFEDHHSILQKVYAKAGYDLPLMIYWNMRDTKKSVVKADQSNVQMVSGFSTMQLKLFLENLDFDTPEPEKKKVTPWDTFRKAMDDECYYDIRKMISSVGEGAFSHYTFIDPVDNDEVVEPAVDACPEVEEVKATVVDSDSNGGVQAANKKDCMAELREAKSMLDEGLIDANEFKILKGKILGSM